MGELRVRVPSESDKEMADKGRQEGGHLSGFFLLVTILAGAGALAAAVWYPTSELVGELGRLVKVLEASSRAGSIGTRDIKGERPERPSLPRDCHDIQQSGEGTNGVYRVYPAGLKRGIDVFCDLTTDDGGWLVFVKRIDGATEFYRNWVDYQFGFGNLTEEFWLGNEYLHMLTSQGMYEMRVDMEDFDGEKRFAKYKLFRIGNRDSRFVLSIAGYSGDAGNSFDVHDGMMFSTKDWDNDKAPGHCAQSFKGAFWYNNCHNVHPTGLYHGGDHETLADGVNWYTWKGYKYSLKHMDLKIRPL